MTANNGGSPTGKCFFRSDQNLPPVTAMATGQCSSRTSAVVVAWQRQSLIPVLLRKDATALKSLLASTEKGWPLAAEGDCTYFIFIFHLQKSLHPSY